MKSKNFLVAALAVAVLSGVHLDGQSQALLLNSGDTIQGAPVPAEATGNWRVVTASL